MLLCAVDLKTMYGYAWRVLKMKQRDIICRQQLERGMVPRYICVNRYSTNVTSQHVNSTDLICHGMCPNVSSSQFLCQTTRPTGIKLSLKHRRSQLTLRKLPNCLRTNLHSFMKVQQSLISFFSCSLTDCYGMRLKIDEEKVPFGFEIFKHLFYYWIWELW